MNAATRRAGRILAMTAILAACGATAYGVHPQNWSAATEKDYSQGTFENVVVSSVGELRLGRELKTIADVKGIDFVQDFAQAKDGTMYFCTAPNGKVFKIADGKAVEYFAAPETNDQIMAMTIEASGKLLIAACGDGAKLLELSENAKGKVEARTVWEDPKVQYVWTMKPAENAGTEEMFCLATGPEGKVLRVGTTTGKASVVAETGAKNVSAMVHDAQGNWVVGTDAEGLVIRIDKNTGKQFVLLDAGNVDVTGLAVDEAGNIYASTAQPDAGGSMQGDEPDVDGPKTRPGKVDPDVDDKDMTPDPATKPGDKDKAGAFLQQPGATNMAGGILLGQTHSPMPNDIKQTLEKLKRLAGEAGGTGGKRPAPTHSPASHRSSSDKKKAAPKGLGGDFGPPEEPGNTVYKISPKGAVTTLMQSLDMITSLAYHKGELVVGTGPDGKLYTVGTDGEAQTMAARVRNENVMSLFCAADGTIYIGASNDGQVYSISAQTADKGSYVSPALDAEHSADWGRAVLTAQLPAGTKATIATRTGNVKDVVKNEKFWSEWSAEIDPSDGGAKIASPTARFLQYRVTLTSEGAAKGTTPIVEDTKIWYQVENMPPVIKNLKAEVDAPPPAGESDRKDADGDNPHTVSVTWDAMDPNHDELTYRILYREVGTDVWVQVAKDLRDTAYTWNTKSVADGKYQVKVIASDAADNVPSEAKAVAAVSATLLVNNTPPVISEVKTTIDGGQVTVEGVAKDGISAIAEVRYQVDSAVDWQLARASDKMFDSPKEGFTFVTKALPSGSHRITIRAIDAAGNSSSKAVTAVVK